MKNKLLKVLFMTVMTLLLMPMIGYANTYYVSSTEGNDSNDGSITTPFATINKALDTITDNTESRIVMLSDITENINAIGTVSRDRSQIASPIRNITLDLNGHTFKSSTYNSAITVWANANFTLNDTSEAQTGKIISSGNTCRGIENLGQLVIRGGTITCDITGKGWMAGGVCCDSNSITYLIGGKIEGCKASGRGAGVYVDSNATFTMYGGEIKDNVTSEVGGGIYVKATAKFNGYSGTISGNSALNGGGIYNDGVVEINGTLVVDNNKATEVAGGIFNYGTVGINGATISNNEAKNGGGIYNHSNRFEITSTTFENNKAINDGDGGAIYVNNGSTVTLNNNSVIKGCSASNNGGGIYNNGALGFEKCKIENCTVTNGNGAGIYLDSQGTLFAGENATAKSNTKDGSKNNIYLTDDTKIKFGTGEDVKTPKQGMSLGITTNTLPLEGQTLDITFNGEEAYSSYLFSDSSDYETKFLDNKYVLQIYVPVPTSHTKKYKANDTKDTAEKISGTGKKGSTRTITPIEGKKVASVVVTDKDGNEIEVTLNEDGTYSFKQPASNVDVQVIYKNREIKLNIGSTKAEVDGEKETLDVAPIIRNDRTMLPIRFIAENLGAKVEWNELESNMVYITRGDIKIEIKLGSEIMKVNDKEVILDQVAFAENDRTYLPVRAVSEALNAIVEWNENEPSVVKIYER